MKKIESLCLLISFLALTYSLAPERLTTQKYQYIMEDQNNVHYFVLSKHVATSKLLQNLQHYTNNQMVRLYQCDISEHLPFCQRGLILYMVINTIKIQFNGHEGHSQDIRKWIQFRINEYPTRMHTIADLRKQASQKFEIFCYVDREGEAISKKEKIFLAVAKTMHYLNFCYLDASIAKELGLKEGHLALIRRNMTITLDARTEGTHQDQKQLLYDAWIRYLIQQFSHDFRIEGRNKFQDQVLLECDRSFQCQQELASLLLLEQKWRDQHPNLNFAIRISNGISGMGTLNQDDEYDYPGFRYVTRQPKEHYEYNIYGQLVRIIDVTHREFLGLGIHISQGSIDKLLQLKQRNKLKYIRQKTSTSIQPLEMQESQQYKHMATNKPPYQDL